MSTPGPAPAAFSVRTREREDAIVVVLCGELDLVSADEVRAALRGAIARKPARVVADLTTVDLLDSTGLGALIEAAEAAGDSCDFALIAPGGLHVRGVLTVSGVLEHITVYESEEEIPAR